MSEVPVSEVQAQIETAWEARDTVTPASSDVRRVVEAALDMAPWCGAARISARAWW